MCFGSTRSSCPPIWPPARTIVAWCAYNMRSIVLAQWNPSSTPWEKVLKQNGLKRWWKLLLGPPYARSASMCRNIFEKIELWLNSLLEDTKHIWMFFHTWYHNQASIALLKTSCFKVFATQMSLIIDYDPYPLEC